MKESETYTSLPDELIQLLLDTRSMISTGEVFDAKIDKLLLRTSEIKKTLDNLKPKRSSEPT